MSCLGLLPPFKEEGNFRFSTYQGCQSSCLSHIKATGGTTFAEHVVDVHGLGNATQYLCSQVLALKISLYQVICRFTDSNRIGRSQSFNARSNIWRFP